MRLYNIGIPYMGSKRKIAQEIVDFILKENPNAKYFYDLFGGGGAISFEALQRHQIKKVFYNEFNTGVVKLLEDIKENGVDKKYFQWIDRETFNENKNKDTWLGGLVKTCWSFGNNQRCYLFGADIEEDKRLLHEIVVNKCQKSCDLLNNKLKTNVQINNKNNLFTDETITQRRLRICKYLGVTKGREDMQQLEQLEQLQQLQRLKQLERLQQLQRLEISNFSYEDVKISTPIDETVIYLDPPYHNTAKYEKNICHNSLYDYIEKSSYQIYMSSYDSHLPCVHEIEHTSSLGTSVNNKVIEKIFTNRVKNKKSKPIQQSLF